MRLKYLNLHLYLKPLKFNFLYFIVKVCFLLSNSATSAAIHLTWVCKQPSASPPARPSRSVSFRRPIFSPEFFYFLPPKQREQYLRQPLARKTTALMTAMPAVMARNRACFLPYWRNQRPMFGAPVLTRPCVSQTHRPNTRPRPEWVCLRHQIPFDLLRSFCERKAMEFAIN